METWILIIFLVVGGNSGAAIDHISGFSSRTACLNFAAKVNTMKYTRIYTRCVKQL